MSSLESIYAEESERREPSSVVAEPQPAPPQEGQQPIRRTSGSSTLKPSTSLENISARLKTLKSSVPGSMPDLSDGKRGRR